MKHQITYTGIGRTVQNEEAQDSLLDISIAHKIPHLHECGGNGKCTTCRVRVINGSRNLNPRTKAEKRAAQERRWDPSIRLGCQAIPKGDIELQRLIWSVGEVNKLQMEVAPEGSAEERSIAILFCDLRNYTRLSSQNMNFDIAFMLNRFYTALGEPILMNNGIIYQYVGDEIVGVFGTNGGAQDKNCTDAIRAAMGMHFALDRLNKIELKDFDIELKSGIGIHFGKAYIGHLGHPTHRQFSVIGDPVNVASRIQSQTKKTETKILISDAVLNCVPKDSLVLGNSFISKVAGKAEKLDLYEVLGFQEMDLQLELQASIQLLLKDDEKFARIFYQKVFEAAPQVRQLFRNNIEDQGRLLTHMLGGIVYTLSRPEHLVLGLRQLGKSHVKYGVKTAYYPVVKEVMLETIDELLGADKTARIMEAWRVALDFILEGMQNWDKK